MNRAASGRQAFEANMKESMEKLGMSPQFG
jgi:hypothetical protein